MSAGSLRSLVARSRAMPVKGRPVDIRPNARLLAWPQSASQPLAATRSPRSVAPLASRQICPSRASCTPGSWSRTSPTRRSWRSGPRRQPRLPGVVAVMTAADLPIVATGRGRQYEPLAREEIVYVGQPVAIVIAETEALADDGAELVEVELEPLRPVVDLEAAARPGSPRARVSSEAPARDPTSATRTPRWRSAASAKTRSSPRTCSGYGAARAGRRRCGARGEPRRRPRHVHDAVDVPGIHRDPERDRLARARWGASGDQSTQAPFATRDGVAELFGLPVERVRVRSAPIGGAFGGKMMIVEPLVVSAVARPSPAGPARHDPQRGHRRDQSRRRGGARARARAPTPTAGSPGSARGCWSIAARPPTSVSSRSPRCSPVAPTAGGPTI